MSEGGERGRERERDPDEEQQGRVLSVRFGRSANCSSVGSIVDVLFVSSVVGTALLGAIAVMLRRPGDERPPEQGPPEKGSSEGEPAQGKADEDSPDPS